MPTTHCCVFSLSALPLLLREKIHKAPAKIPILVMEVRSKNTDCCKAVALTGWLQKALVLGSNRLPAVAILAAHKPKPYTTPQGCPAITKLSTANNARSTAPIIKVLLNRMREPPLVFDQNQAAKPITIKPK